MVSAQADLVRGEAELLIRQPASPVPGEHTRPEIVEDPDHVADPQAVPAGPPGALAWLGGGMRAHNAASMRGQAPDSESGTSK
jgi:hypothetical protein